MYVYVCMYVYIYIYTQHDVYTYITTSELFALSRAFDASSEPMLERETSRAEAGDVSQASLAPPRAPPSSLSVCVSLLSSCEGDTRGAVLQSRQYYFGKTTQRGKNDLEGHSPWIPPLDPTSERKPRRYLEGFLDTSRANPPVVYACLYRYMHMCVYIYIEREREVIYIYMCIYIYIYIYIM